MRVNTEILKKCRMQMGLEIKDVKKKVPKITEIEASKKDPTPNQLTALAELYQVPRWVFIESRLPKEYQYETQPVFGQFKKSPIFSHSKVRQLMTRVEQYRSLFLELREDSDEPIPKFSTPATPLDSAEQTAEAVRKWLKLDSALAFDSLREKLEEKLEEKHIFIFMTSKYKGWSQIDKKSFRGLSIFYNTLPVIIINDSDSKNAQSFTLFHELGHILKEHTVIGCDNVHQKEERWCDELAGCVLMPSHLIQKLKKESFENLEKMKKIAKHFKVSPYSCLVRLKQLNLISQKKYKSIEEEIKVEYDDLQEKLKNNKGGPARKHIQEVQKQFGRAFIQTVIHVMNNRELTLHKASQILDIKRPSLILELEKDR